MMFFSVSLLSAPFKHFTYLLTEKLARKKISSRKKIGKYYPTNPLKFNSLQQLLYG
jgi:hypothetical protein